MVEEAVMVIAAVKETVRTTNDPTRQPYHPLSALPECGTFCASCPASPNSRSYHVHALDPTFDRIRDTGHCCGTNFDHEPHESCDDDPSCVRWPNRSSHEAHNHCHDLGPKDVRRRLPAASEAEVHGIPCRMLASVDC